MLQTDIAGRPPKTVQKTVSYVTVTGKSRIHESIDLCVISRLSPILLKSIISGPTVSQINAILRPRVSIYCVREVRNQMSFQPCSSHQTPAYLKNSIPECIPLCALIWHNVLHMSVPNNNFPNLLTDTIRAKSARLCPYTEFPSFSHR